MGNLQRRWYKRNHYKKCYGFALDRALKQISDYSSYLNTAESCPEKKVGEFIKLNYMFCSFSVNTISIGTSQGRTGIASNFWASNAAAAIAAFVHFGKKRS